MKNETNFYSLQLRPVEMSADSLPRISELEVIALPAAGGSVKSARFRQWEPIFERICAIVSSSPFHRKAMRRTLQAGLPAHLIDRATGGKHLFSDHELAELELDTAEGLDTAA